MEIDEKFKFAKQIIMDLVKSGLAYVQTYADTDYKLKDQIIDFNVLSNYLNNPGNWNPSSKPMPCLEITAHGSIYLKEQMELRESDIKLRLFSTNSNT